MPVCSCSLFVPVGTVGACARCLVLFFARVCLPGDVAGSYSVFFCFFAVPLHCAGPILPFFFFDCILCCDVAPAALPIRVLQFLVSGELVTLFLAVCGRFPHAFCCRCSDWLLLRHE